MTYKKRFSLLAAVCSLGAVLVAAQNAADPAVKLVITGDVAVPLTLSVQDLAQMPREHVDVEEPTGKSAYEEVPLQEILKKAGIGFGREMRGKALASYVLAQAHDGYAVVFGLGELDAALGGAHVLVADKRDGKPLPPQQGPIRLVIPADKEGARSVRMLEKLEVVKLRK